MEQSSVTRYITVIIILYSDYMYRLIFPCIQDVELRNLLDQKLKVNFLYQLYTLRSSIIYYNCNT